MEAQRDGEGKQGTTAAAKALTRRVTGRISLLVGALSLVLVLGSAQAASAWHLTSVSPTSGCPGTEVAFTGTSFSGSTSKIRWTDPSSLILTWQETTAKVSHSTKATGIVPLFFQTEGSGVGTTSIDGSDTVVFTSQPTSELLQRRHRSHRPDRSHGGDRLRRCDRRHR